ncbi:MAG: hypothetical protein ABJV04_04555 [Aliiglaciecola sp.]|uniref:hypothetical protein n=1 Tax=Aliiglaciecola sp. TaxID=1872441 RepID=UPI003299057D
MNRKLNFNQVEEITGNELSQICGGSETQYIPFYAVDKSGRELSPTDPARKGKKLNPPVDLNL